MRKKILAIVTSIILSASLLITPFASYAAGLTQATNASKVIYGTLSAEDIQLLRSVFDADYYAANNPDLAGKSKSQLFDHFITKGIFEGRTCNAEFDPAAYASANKGLLEKYKKDIIAYYRDFYSKYKATRATLIATLEACANAKITVTGLADDSTVITPELYFFAKAYNIKEYALAKATQQAAQTGQPTEVQGNGDGTVNAGDGIVIIPEGGNAEALARAMGLTDLGMQIQANGVLLHIYVSYAWIENDGNWNLNVTGAAIKDDNNNSVYTYQDYTENDSESAGHFEIAQIYAGDVLESFGEVPEGPKLITSCFNVEAGRIYGSENIECTSATVYPIEETAYYADTNGDETTSYTVTGDLSLEGEGFETVITGSVGIYNEETGFGYVADYSADLYEAQ